MSDYVFPDTNVQVDLVNARQLSGAGSAPFENLPLAPLAQSLRWKMATSLAATLLVAASTTLWVPLPAVAGDVNRNRTAQMPQDSHALVADLLKAYADSRPTLAKDVSNLVCRNFSYNTVDSYDLGGLYGISTVHADNKELKILSFTLPGAGFAGILRLSEIQLSIVFDNRNAPCRAALITNGIGAL